MKKISLFVIANCLLSMVYCQLPGYWQQQVNYTIDVTLNDEEHSLDGYIKMDYFNNSPDTLKFIWIHVWPNAYKNDRTAFSDQLLENGRTDFYFSDNDKHGYINRLDFKVNNINSIILDHPQHQDIVKLILPLPLVPGSNCKIESPFRVKLPHNFSRGGHVGQSYQITQWYPKPAVYDKKGWHAIPYLDQGEFYSEFGNYEVNITIPKNYIVAATGTLQNETEINWLKERSNLNTVFTLPSTKSPIVLKKAKEDLIAFPASSKELKTISFKQDNVHDFAWFADKRFVVQQDTLQLQSGKIINVASYALPSITNYWKNSLQFIKKSILTRSKWLGEYPYNTATAVEAMMGFEGGMEYPTITSISPPESENELEGTIEHEVGHNWNYGILGTNEREHAWMDEGINSFYDDRYDATEMISTPVKSKQKFWSKRMPDNRRAFSLRNIIANKTDQPIETPADSFSEINYYRMSYQKTAEWLGLLEKVMGKELFDSCMQAYYERWKFKHPYPEDFKKIFEEAVEGKGTGGSISSSALVKMCFQVLNYKGPILPFTPAKRPLKLASFFSFKDTHKYRYIFVAPGIGNNFYDGLMLGGVVHNYTLPAEKFQFFVSPLYGTQSKQMNGLGRISYHWLPGNKGKKIELSLSASKFSENDFTDSNNHTEYLYFSKLVPSIKINFAKKNPRSHVSKFIQWKTFFIAQKGILFTRDTVANADIITYPITNKYINQLRFVIENDRVLYPYNGELKVEQGKSFVRAAFTGNYFFNYVKGGGMNVRLFAGKFFYLGDNTFLKQFETDPYHLNMTGPRGYEDYTYSNYFYGRNEFEKISSQQIMQRDGFFKVRTDLLSSKIGKTDKWLAALNLTTDVPKNINPLQMLPIKIPLKAFFDIGTYADAWQKNATTGRFIYDAGLQISLFKDIVNIYVPILYSKVYSDYFKSTITEKRFWKNISFSIDIQNIKLKKTFPQIPAE
ncbi:M1 family metallopeptidase [Ferruginibacter sp. SUN002]|uniref:M1 family metallopeptidase n=1 Tax=Ferruginibacter sp. SUN002 TaxID=2937789 RepID=UPI003D36E7F1